MLFDRPPKGFRPGPLLYVLPARGEYLKTVPESIKVMDDVIEALPAAGMMRLYPFFRVYRSVTKRAYEWYNDGKFRYGEYVAQNIPPFAQLADDPLRDFALGDLHKVPYSWRFVFTSGAIEDATDANKFSGGMFTHIDHDLARSMAKTKSPPEYEHDFKVNMHEVLREVAEDYTSGKEDMNLLPLQPEVSGVALNGMLGMIAHERGYAYKMTPQVIRARDMFDSGEDPKGKELARIGGELEWRALRNVIAFTYPGDMALKGLMRVFPLVSDAPGSLAA